MDDSSSTTAYWVAAAIILVLFVIGVALWYSATTTTPAIPNTGSDTTTNIQTTPLDASGAGAEAPMTATGTTY